MYGDYGNRHIPNYDENHSRTNGFPPEKSPFQRSQSISNRPTAKTIYQQRKAYAQALNSTDSLIQYRVEHLFTCDLNSKDIKTVDHCIKKLKLLDAKGKIWGQDMILQLTGTTFKMADIETKDDLELFPIDAIQDSQAILNSCIYNSVLAVTIRDRTKNKSSVYLFQCEDVSADLIQNDIDNMIRGKKEVQGNQDILRSNLESMLSQHPRPPYGKSSMPPPEERWIPPDYDKPQHPAMSEHGSWADRQSRTSSEYGSKFSNDDGEKTIPSFLIVQRNTDILNHTLEDIELFNNKIIQAIGSNTEKALKKKKKSKKHKEALPPEEEYKECLQKIKYAFNLISKLEAQLQAPSAPDLVNVLFQILGFVDIKDSKALFRRSVIPSVLVNIYPSTSIIRMYYLILRSIPNPDLAPNVIIPFLIPGAIQFLNSNTSAEERDIWRSLGDAWNTPRSDWPNGESFQSFVPTFSSGWEPPTLQSLRFPRPNLSDDSTRPKQQMGNSYAAPFERSQNNPKWAKAMYDFMKRNTRELTVMKGDNLEVLEATRQWWKVKDQNGYVGYVPSNIMQLMNLEESLPSHIDDHHSFQYPFYADSPHLTVRSTPSEVATWLKKKGFSKVTVKSLQVLTGSQLLSLTKEELKMVSAMEGHIVYDEIHSGQ